MMKQTLVVLMALALVQCKKDKDDNDPLRKGLLAVYKLDNNFEDSTKKTKTVMYSVDYISAVPDRHNRLESAMNFDGGKMIFTVDNWKAYPLSISVWVKPKDFNNDDPLIWAETGAFAVYQQDSKMGMLVSTPNTKTAFATIGKGWIHMVGTYDGQELRTYINGVLKNSIEHPGEPDITKMVNMGSSGSAAWKGAIDDVRFYNRILNDEEIDLLANQ